MNSRSPLKIKEKWWSNLLPDQIRQLIESNSTNGIRNNGVATVPVKRRSYSIHQNLLAMLPVPSLEGTLQKYLATVRPLVTDDEFKRVDIMVKEFGSPGGIGEQLQKRLEERADHTINWLEEWWLRVTYLQCRLPSPIFVNPGIRLPTQEFESEQDHIRFAARLVAGVLDYKIMIDNELLPVEYLGGDPLCMNQYYKILSSCRIPGSKIDSCMTCHHTDIDAPTHIVVVHNNQFFKVNVYEEGGKVPLGVDEIAGQLEKVITASQTPGPAVGSLTSGRRQTWSKLYSNLIKDKRNKESIRDIQRSIFVLCLDKPSPDMFATEDRHSIQLPSNMLPGTGQSMPDIVPPDDRQSISLAEMMHGSGSKYNSGNRWFDKVIQVIINRDGAVGVNYEHSTAEGPPIVALFDHALTYGLDNRFETITIPTTAEEPQKLTFNLSDSILKAIKVSEEKFDNFIHDLDLVSWTFEKFGKDFIKSQKMSPDAFIQVSLQLAYYRTHGHQTATYESGSLRKFQHGRTDTIRSCSIDSAAFCHAMDTHNVARDEKVRLLVQAVKSHRQYTDDVVQGKGIDRHLFGLRMTAVEAGQKIPEFFTDPAFVESCKWRLSTSQVASKYNALLGFGPSVEDGYGVCYNPASDKIHYSIAAWKSCSQTDAKTLAENIQRSLLDAYGLLLAEQQ